MDKKAKKRVLVLRERMQKLQKLLTFARQQTDDPAEITTLERQIAEIQKEIAGFADE